MDYRETIEEDFETMFDEHECYTEEGNEPKTQKVQIKRYLQNKTSATRLEIVNSLCKRFGWKEGSLYNTIRQMLKTEEIVEDEDLIYLDLPPQVSDFMDGAAVFASLLNQQRAANVLPFDELNEIVGGVVPGEVVVYLAPGSKGKSSFLIQTTTNVTKMLPTMYLTTSEGSVYRVMSQVASIDLDRRINEDDLIEIAEKAQQGDPKAKQEMSDIIMAFNKYHCKHLDSVKFSRDMLREEINKYNERKGHNPQVVSLDYLKDGYVHKDPNDPYGHYARECERIFSYCKKNNIILITAHQDRPKKEYPEQPTFYGASDLMDSVDILLWQQGTVVNKVSGIATNLIKLQKTKRGPQDSFVVTKVDTHSYKPISCTEPLTEEVAKQKLQEAKVQEEEGFDLNMEGR